ncbi:MAG: alpha-isopropylmalate synthase regulatory domain-containing protein [Leptospirales bacterium]
MTLKTIEIMDTTLRDGEQTNDVSFSSSEKYQIARILLEKVGVDRIEVASALVSEGEKEAATRILQWAEEHNYTDRVEILGYVDDTRSVDWIKECGGRVFNMLTKGSLKHLTHQLRKTPEEHIDGIRRSAQYAKENGFIVNAYLEDWSNGYKDSRDYVYKLIEAMSHMEIDRIMIPDTLGVMYPEEVFQAIEDLRNRFPDVHFDFHAHNDYGLGTINTMEAVRAGAKAVHVTVNCLGERTGNASLAEVVAGLHDFFQIKTNVQEEHLHLASRVVENFSGKRLADNAPIVGEDVFTQTSGIHADGDKKAGLYESALMPERFGRKRVYALGKMAGKASIDQNLKELGLELSDENRKKVLDKVKSLGDKKKKVTMEDLPFIISEVLNLPVHEVVKFKHVRVKSGMDLTPSCTLILSYKSKDYEVSGTGDGGYDAFMNAIREWGNKNSIALPLLKDYEVRIPPGGRTSALVECKIIWEKVEGKTIVTRGVDPDQTMAAVQATEKMLNLLLD